MNVVSIGRVHRTTHSVQVDAAAGVVYGLISDAVQWPLYFPPNVNVERLEFDGTHERLRMWATANGEVRSWISERVQDPRNGGSSSGRPCRRRPSRPCTAPGSSRNGPAAPAC